MNCPNCGTQLPDGTPACPACGAQFAPAPMQQPAYNPYGQAQAPVAAKKSNTGLIIGIIIAVIAIAAAIVLVIVLKGKKGSSDHDGTYYLTSMSDGFTTYTVEDMKAFGLDMSDVGLKITGDKIEFVGGEALGLGAFTSSKVTFDGDKMTITDPDGSKMTGTITGNTISITSDGVTMEFKK